jgi:hypothetical protein
MKIIIETIPHEKQRYPTVGDWYYAPFSAQEITYQDFLRIKVSDLGDWRREALVAVHELIEFLICKHEGVTAQQVDEFDMAFEKARDEKLAAARTQAEKELLLIDEAGDAPACPYGRQHSAATGVERILAAYLTVGWSAYEKQIEML